MKPPFRVVSDNLPTETVAVLTELLNQAKRKRILGIAFAVMYRGGTYIVNATDEARRSHTFARGMVAELDDELARQMHGEAPSS